MHALPKKNRNAHGPPAIGHVCASVPKFESWLEQKYPLSQSIRSILELAGKVNRS